MEQPNVLISVYPEHFIVTCELNGETYEGRGELLSTALFELAEQLEYDYL